MELDGFDKGNIFYVLAKLIVYTEKDTERKGFALGIFPQKISYYKT